jgi:hypothetical protein
MSAGTACRLEADANLGHRNFNAGARKPIPAAIRGPRATRHERSASAAARSAVSCMLLFDGPTLPTKSLAQIGDEVFRMFEANRKTE